MIYFDNAASMKPCKAALKAFNDCAELNFANPSALHKGGIEAEKVITTAKKTILSKFLQTQSGDFIFTSGGTESNNLAVFGVNPAKKRRIVTTAIEHPSVAAPLNELEKRGFEVVWLSPVHNEDFEEQIIKAADENTFLVSVMSVNNETGFITDTARIYKEIKRKFPDCVIHADAAQGFLKLPDKIDADIVSVSAHKIGGIKGAGGLYIKNNIHLKPLFYGGGQQKNLRSGTEPTELIAAFGAAVENFYNEPEYFTKLSAYLTQHLSQIKDVYINSRNNLPHIMNFSVRGVKSEILLHYFAENKIYISSGSACARGKKSKSLLAAGVSEKDADSALRLSFSSENATDEIDEFIKVLQTGIQRFKR
ncbi:MAG: cysteine desulfurase [Oscillospiraceae bacterium]|nr:cysteine desulfurase [Oscillospiraceae bacterium]